MQERLKEAFFAECAAGCMVNLRHVDSIGKDEACAKGYHLPVSRRMYRPLVQALMDYIGGVV